jgi:hypothetical protein
MHLIERKILASNKQALEASKTCSEKAARQQWLHVDIPIITEVDFSSAQLRPPRGGHDVFCAWDSFTIQDS